MNRFRTFLLIAMTIGSVAFALDASAQQQQSAIPQNQTAVTERPVSVDEDYTTYQQIARKLGRGISNAAFGALELPIVILDVNYNEGGIAALTYGVFLGLGVVVCRELVGVLEILTFYMPLPNCPINPHGGGWGYGPIMRPEWIITPETNAYNFVFPTSKTMY